MNWHVIPYIFSGTKLYAAECGRGTIDGYFDTRKEAQDRCDKLNNGTASVGCLGGVE